MYRVPGRYSMGSLDDVITGWRTLTSLKAPCVTASAYSTKLPFIRTMMDAQSNNYPYTIVRIKRKRTDEPLDALGVLLVPPVHEVKFLLWHQLSSLGFAERSRKVVAMFFSLFELSRRPSGRISNCRKHYRWIIFNSCRIRVTQEFYHPCRTKSRNCRKSTMKITLSPQCLRMSRICLGPNAIGN